MVLKRDEVRNHVTLADPGKVPHNWQSIHAYAVNRKGLKSADGNEHNCQHDWNDGYQPYHRVVDSKTRLP